MYYNVNFNVFFKSIRVHLLVSELYIYQNVRCKDKKKQCTFVLICCRLDSRDLVYLKISFCQRLLSFMRVMNMRCIMAQLLLQPLHRVPTPAILVSCLEQVCMKFFFHHVISVLCLVSHVCVINTALQGCL